jgi:hypothetical protein
MLNFKNISALHAFLTNIHQKAQGQAARELLSTVLQRDLHFNAEQAQKYAFWVLARNSEHSAEVVSRNAEKLIGKWSVGSSNGSAGNLLVTRTESWIFARDLTYEYRRESYEGYVSPFGGGYSRPSSSSKHGIWAPNDDVSSLISLVTIDQDGLCANRTIRWIDPAQTQPTAIELNNIRFGKM